MIANANYLSIVIFDKNGQVIKNVYSGSVESGYINDYSWDGTDNNSNPVGNNLYFYLITAQKGTETTVTRGTIIVLR